MRVAIYARVSTRDKDRTQKRSSCRCESTAPRGGGPSRASSLTPLRQQTYAGG